ncbi:MAG: acetoacetyl-CoA synthase [Betaproteobacteria bacterium RIFCSPLOWO2_12_FULL_67_28]|nr:MAG: acetoacetyl-CoA synthase [Betaproteobacteria bacterium RIFCSPLOWO2_12_FULL_67_28]
MNARLPASASKRPANVSVRAELLDKAKRLGINLSRTLEDRLAELVREAEAREWLGQNQRAIDAYNKRVEREGIWSDGLRGF